MKIKTTRFAFNIITLIGSRVNGFPHRSSKLKKKFSDFQSPLELLSGLFVEGKFVMCASRRSHIAFNFGYEMPFYAFDERRGLISGMRNEIILFFYSLALAHFMYVCSSFCF
jgi:hypothetical protein